MDYEKKHQEDLEAAKGWLAIAKENNNKIAIQIVEKFFPELKESEDEKNIKDLIDELKCSLRAANCQNDACGGGHEKRIALLEWGIAWLEKQGEQKPEIKYIYPKFRVGDVIEPTKPNGYYVPVRVKHICDGYYYCESDDYKSFLSLPTCNENEYVLTEQNPAWSEEDEVGLGYALWAIEQARSIAKDGNDMGNLWHAERWLKLLKYRMKGE